MLACLTFNYAPEEYVFWFIKKLGMLIKIFELWNLFENSAHNSFKLALRDFMYGVNSISEFKFENKS